MSIIASAGGKCVVDRNTGSEIAVASTVWPRTWTHVIDDARTEAGATSEVRAA